MHLAERLHVVHRAWRYRLRTEKDEVKFLLSRRLAGQVVLDIGANRGVYSYWAHKKVGAQGQVYAFEPQPELNTYLHQLKQAFRLDRLQIVHTALSDTAGERSLLRPREQWGGASFELNDNAPSDVDTLQVPVTTLDTYFVNQQRRPIRFIKCDVEGHELEVFRGGENLLREDHPELLFECHDRYVEDGAIFEFLGNLNYDGFFFAHGQLQPVSEYTRIRPTLPNTFLNFVFLPQRKAAA